MSGQTHPRQLLLHSLLRTTRNAQHHPLQILIANSCQETLLVALLVHLYQALLPTLPKQQLVGFPFRSCSRNPSKVGNHRMHSPSSSCSSCHTNVFSFLRNSSNRTAHYLVSKFPDRSLASLQTGNLALGDSWRNTCVRPHERPQNITQTKTSLSAIRGAADDVGQLYLFLSVITPLCAASSMGKP